MFELSRSKVEGTSLPWKVSRGPGEAGGEQAQSEGTEHSPENKQIKNGVESDWPGKVTSLTLWENVKKNAAATKRLRGGNILRGLQMDGAMTEKKRRFVVAIQLWLMFDGEESWRLFPLAVQIGFEGRKTTS